MDSLSIKLMYIGVDYITITWLFFGKNEMNFIVKQK